MKATAKPISAKTTGGRDHPLHSHVQPFELFEHRTSPKREAGGREPAFPDYLRYTQIHAMLPHTTRFRSVLQ